MIAGRPEQACCALTCRWNLVPRLTLSFRTSIEVAGERMSEHFQLASAMLAIGFAAGMLLAGDIFIRHQSAEFAPPGIYLASLPP
jgi:hypothetical protein